MFDRLKGRTFRKTRLNHGLTDVTVDGVLEGALEVRVEVGDHLFLDFRPVDHGIGVGGREMNLGPSDVDRGADGVFDKVQVANSLDDVGFVCGSVVVSLAFG